MLPRHPSTTVADLFNQNPPPEPCPAQRHSPTSVEAARQIKTTAVSLRHHVLAYLRQCGEQGATDEEIQAATGLNPSTERPRRVELVQAGLVINSGKTRKTRSGCDAAVWVTLNS